MNSVWKKFLLAPSTHVTVDMQKIISIHKSPKYEKRFCQLDYSVPFPWSLYKYLLLRSWYVSESKSDVYLARWNALPQSHSQKALKTIFYLFAKLAHKIVEISFFRSSSSSSSFCNCEICGGFILHFQGKNEKLSNYNNLDLRFLWRWKKAKAVYLLQEFFI